MVNYNPTTDYFSRDFIGYFGSRGIKSEGGYQAIHPVRVDSYPRITTVQDGKAELYLLQLIKDQRQVSIRHLGTRRELEPKGVPQVFVGFLLRARWSAIGHFFPVSLETVPEVFAKINWTQFPRCL